MIKNKQTSSKSATFAKGGSTGMFGKQSAGPKAKEATGKKDSGSGGKFAAGGSTGMFGKQAANPKAPSKTGK